MTGSHRYRCECCGAHALREPRAQCALCRWPDEAYELDEARRNVEAYGVAYRPADFRFAVIRHPILGVRGETAIDRVALRERVYAEFSNLMRHAEDCAELPARLENLLETVEYADRLYTRAR